MLDMGALAYFTRFDCAGRGGLPSSAHAPLAANAATSTAAEIEVRTHRSHRAAGTQCRPAAASASPWTCRMRRIYWIVAGSDWVECEERTTSSDAAPSRWALRYATTPSLPSSARPSPFTAMIE